MRSIENKKKFKKCFKIKKRGFKYGFKKYFIGLQALNSGKISLKQLEAFRVSVSRGLRLLKSENKKKKENLLKILYSFIVNDFWSETSKVIGSRMGKGKGKHKKWILYVSKGQIIFELKLNFYNILVYKIIKRSIIKLPIKVKIKRLIY